MSAGVETLVDGARVLIRTLCPADAPHVRRVFAAMSETSRYRRFMGARASLSDAEVRYLTETDAHAHVALIALDLERGEAVGIARYVRVVGEARLAEPAIAVIDAWQHRGVGTLLLQRLVAIAHEGGVETFRAHVLASNTPMRRLIGRWRPGLHPRQDGPEVEYRVPVAEDRGPVAMPSAR